MLNLIVVTVVTLLYYYWHYKEDLIDSRKEATIKRLRKIAGEKDQLAADLKEKGQWHFYNWSKVALYALLAAFLSYGITLNSLAIIWIIGTLRIVYFNPMISLGLGSTFFHLGNGKWEKRFHGKEKLYYFTNLALLIACYFLIILKIL